MNDKKPSTLPEDKPSTPAAVKPGTPAADPAFEKKCGETALLLRGKQELTKRLVNHIETIVASATIAFNLKFVLLIKTAEFMSAILAEVAKQITIAGLQHANKVAVNVMADLNLQQETLKKTTERCRSISHDAAMAQKAKLEMMKGVAHDLCKLAKDIAMKLDMLSGVAAGNNTNA